MPSDKSARRRFFIYDEDTEEVLGSFTSFATTQHQLPPPNASPARVPFPAVVSIHTRDADDAALDDTDSFLAQGPAQGYELDAQLLSSLQLNRLHSLPGSPENNHEPEPQEVDITDFYGQRNDPVSTSPQSTTQTGLVRGYTAQPLAQATPSHVPLRKPNHLPLHSMSFNAPMKTQYRVRVNANLRTPKTLEPQRRNPDITPESRARRERRKYLGHRDSWPTFGSAMSAVMERVLTPNEYALLE